MRGSLFPDGTPGQDELNVMCRNARRVVTLCDAINAGVPNLEDELEAELLRSPIHELRLPGPPDGSFISPDEEF